MYVHVEHYIDDDNYAEWLASNGIESDIYSLEDPDLLTEYVEAFCDSGQVVKIL